MAEDPNQEPQLKKPQELWRLPKMMRRSNKLPHLQLPMNKERMICGNVGITDGGAPNPLIPAEVRVHGGIWRNDGNSHSRQTTSRSRARSTGEVGQPRMKRSRRKDWSYEDEEEEYWHDDDDRVWYDKTDHCNVRSYILNKMKECYSYKTQP